MQGIRGAITVENDNREEIIEAVKKLLINILEANDITAEDIGAALFSATKDLSSLIKEQMEMLLDKSPALSSHFKWLRSEVRFTAKKSAMKPLAYSLDKLDGRKAAVWLSDETGALPTRYPIDSMRSSQMNQLNKTGIIISTAYQNTDNPMTHQAY